MHKRCQVTKVYGPYTNEELLGRALKGLRDRVRQEQGYRRLAKGP
jgi:hypothetical protein